jgi:hypothetical protein
MSPREAHANEDARREIREAKLLRKSARRALKRTQKSQPKEKS